MASVYIQYRYRSVSFAPRRAPYRVHSAAFRPPHDGSEAQLAHTGYSCVRVELETGSEDAPCLVYLYVPCFVFEGTSMERRSACDDGLCMMHSSTVRACCLPGGTRASTDILPATLCGANTLIARSSEGGHAPRCDAERDVA